MLLSWPFNTFKFFPVDTSQIIMELSAEPDAKLPSERVVKQVISCECPSNVRTLFPEEGSQIRIVLSEDPEAKRKS